MLCAQDTVVAIGFNYCGFSSHLLANDSLNYIFSGLLSSNPSIKIENKIELIGLSYSQHSLLYTK